MKLNVSITGIGHDDLVYLISTAASGGVFGFHYNKDDYYGAELVDETDCLEDKCAKILLEGKSIIVTDYMGEGKESYGSLPNKPSKFGDAIDYEVTLEDIKKGLEKCFTYSEYQAANVATLVENPSDFDAYMADCVMEVIVFGEIIYG